VASSTRSIHGRSRGRGVDDSCAIGGQQPGDDLHLCGHPLHDASAAAGTRGGDSRGRIHVSETLVQVGFASDVFGFRANNFFNKTVPIFWGGDVKVAHSVISLQWERNLFHTKKVFALDIGASYSEWRSRNANDGFRTLSLFPVLRFTVLHTKPSDLYVSFSQAGPTYISKIVIDGLPTGSHFTFQDFMAVGMFLGPRKRLNVELNLNHYSNGNLMAENAGVMVPLALKFGYAF
jgi:hypothetical protein